jgi:hypothetical protein
MGNNAKVGGILSIVSGGFGVLIGCVYVGFIWLFNFMITSIPQQPMEPEFPQEMFLIMAAIYGGIGLILALIGVLAIVGGVYAIKKKRWGLALAGAIASDIVFTPCGIPAIIFVCLGKEEFTTGGRLPTGEAL